MVNIDSLILFQEFASLHAQSTVAYMVIPLTSAALAHARTVNSEITALKDARVFARLNQVIGLII
jgi:hypothetical protein